MFLYTDLQDGAANLLEDTWEQEIGSGPLSKLTHPLSELVGQNILAGVDFVMLSQETYVSL